jgi:hypothetical protein
MSKTLAAALVSLHYVFNIISVLDEALSPCRSSRGYDNGFRAASHVWSLCLFLLGSIGCSFPPSFLVPRPQLTWVKLPERMQISLLKPQVPCHGPLSPP